LGITSIKFSPKSGFSRNWQEQLIEGNHADVAVEWGKVVNYDKDGVVTVASDYGYFTMLESTVDGPSELECITGNYQMWEIKVGKPLPLLNPVEGATVYTVHVAKGEGEADLAKGQLCILKDGVYVTDADATVPKGKIRALPADTGRTGLYVVEIMNV
jgi:hypothetical protein